jgi:hypothetical protein
MWASGSMDLRQGILSLTLLYYMDLQQDSRAFWASGSLDLRGAVDMLIIFQLHRSDQVCPSGMTECRSIIVRSAQKIQQASARP